MELNDYQNKAMTFVQPTSDNLLYMAFGLTEEVGELSGKIAKAIRKGWIVFNQNNIQFTDKPTIEERNELIDGILKEMGDIMWMLNGYAKKMNVDADFVGQLNIKKLTDRKERNVIVGEGDNR